MLETERLLLRRPTLDDVERVPWLDDPVVMDWLGGVAPREPVVRRWVEEWDRFPSGKFLVERAGEVIGRVGANYYDPDTWLRDPGGEPELGWALARAHWGHGYATEAALAIREWLSAPRVISLIAPKNSRSQAVARRLRAHPAETIDLPDGGPHVIWVHPSVKIPS